ncbi:MAG: hypothetical protein ACHQRK_10635, partial [Gemmatimonadales bacterium]
MNRIRALLVLLAALSFAPAGLHAQSAAPSQSAHPDIDSFNRALADATRRMDNAATLALWNDDGVSLLPSTKPIVGKAAIGAFVNAMTASFPGAHMEKFD